MRKLTDEPDRFALWLHPIYGARTLTDIAALDALPRKAPTPSKPPPMASKGLEARNERCIGEYGCGMY